MIEDGRRTSALAEKEYEQLLQSALDAYVAVLVVDLDDRVLYANRQWCDIWGYADGPPGVVDTELLTLARTMIHDVDAFEARIVYLRANPHETSFELVQFNDGKILERLTAPLYLAGELRAQIWAFRDLSDRLSPSLLSPSHGLMSGSGESARRLASTAARVRDFVSRHVEEMCAVCAGLVSLLHDAIEYDGRKDEPPVPALSRYTRMYTATYLGYAPNTIGISDTRGAGVTTISQGSDILLGAELFVVGLAAGTTGGEDVPTVRIRDAAIEIAGTHVGEYPDGETHTHIDIARDCIDLIRRETGYTRTARPGLVRFARFPFEGTPAGAEEEG